MVLAPSKGGQSTLAVHFSDFVTHYGSLAVFILMTLESTCIPIPSEAVMPYAGYLAFTGHMSFVTAVIVGTLANVVGGLIAYYIGKKGGRAFILRYGRYVLLNEHHLIRAETWFARRGEITVFVARLLPALRTFISLPAGVANMPLGKFIVYSLLGSLPWNLALVWAGFALGQNWDTVGTYLKPLTYFAAAVLVLSVLWFWFGRRRARNARRSDAQS
jgi:membrane protein DedA with SNARE-associated domain